MMAERGIILTHAHEDHMGGIPYILPKVQAPIYTARFSAGMVEKKLVSLLRGQGLLASHLQASGLLKRG